MGVFTIDHYVNNKYDRIKTNAQYEAHRFGLDYETVLNQSLRVLEETKGDYTDEQGTNGFIRFYNKLLFNLCTTMKKQKYADKASDKVPSEDKSEFEIKKEAAIKLNRVNNEVKEKQPKRRSTFRLAKKSKKEVILNPESSFRTKLPLEESVKESIEGRSELSLNNLNKEELTALEVYYIAKYNIIVDRLDIIKNLKYKQS